MKFVFWEFTILVHLKDKLKLGNSGKTKGFVKDNKYLIELHEIVIVIQVPERT